MDESKGDTSFELVDQECPPEANLDRELQVMAIIESGMARFNATLRQAGQSELPPLNIPSVVLIGNQNSGKSTLIEAETGVSLPQGHGLCTRQVIQIDCAPSPDGTTYFTCEGDPDHLTAEELLARIEAASQAIKDSDSGHAFSHEKLCVNAYRPGGARFRIIDTPGLTASSPDISAEDQAYLAEMIMSIIKVPSCLIIEVLEWSSKGAECSLATKLVHGADPPRERTITAYSKCDVQAGGDESLVDLRHCVAVEPRAFFLTVKDVSQKPHRMLSNAEEVEWFKSKGVEGSTVGQAALQSFIGKELMRLVQAFMPDVINTLKARKVSIEKTLERLGTSTNTEGMARMVREVLAGERLFHPASSAIVRYTRSQYHLAVSSGQASAKWGFTKALATPPDNELRKALRKTHIFEQSEVAVPHRSMHRLIAAKADEWKPHIRDVIEAMRTSMRNAIATALDELPVLPSKASVSKLMVVLGKLLDVEISVLQNGAEELRVDYRTYKPLSASGDKYVEQLKALYQRELQRPGFSGASPYHVETIATLLSALHKPDTGEVLECQSNAYFEAAAEEFAAAFATQVRNMINRFQSQLHGMSDEDLAVEEDPSTAQKRELYTQLNAQLREVLDDSYIALSK